MAVVGGKEMKVGDRVRIIGTKVWATVIEVNGNHVTVKFDTMSVTPQVLLIEEVTKEQRCTLTS